MADLTRGTHDATAETRRWHEHAFVLDSLMIDYAIDDPWLEKVRAGGVKAAFYDFGAEEDWDRALRRVHRTLERIDRSPHLALATKADDVLAANRDGRIALILGAQAAAFIGSHFWRLRLLHRLGVRWLQLTYSYGEVYGDGCAELRNGGLTYTGREFIDAMNELPMMLDLSHCGHRTSDEAIDRSRAPIFTHANSYSVVPNDRNKKDDAIKAIVAKGGMIGLCGLPSSVKPANPTLDDWIDHADHLTRLVGHEHVGIGGDYMEKYKSGKIVPDATRHNRKLRPDIFGTVDNFLSETYPKGVEVVEKLPNFTQGLLDRGYREAQVRGILGENWLRTFRGLVG